MRGSIVSRTRKLGHRRPVFRILLDLSGARFLTAYSLNIAAGFRRVALDNTCAALVVVAKPK